MSQRDTCPFESRGGNFVCTECGLRTASPGRICFRDGKISRRKKIKLRTKKQGPGLGDIVERWLANIGITNRRIIAVKKYFGFKPKCGCQWRKEWLNKVGRAIAEWLKKVLRYVGVGRSQPTQRSHHGKRQR